MRLTHKALKIIGNTKDIKGKRSRTRLALALNFTERWILKCIHENKENGPLTTIAALNVIREETGLSDEQLLEEADSLAA